MKHFKLLVLLLCSSTIIGHIVNAQAGYSKFLVNNRMKGTFSFVNHWDYPTGVFKDDGTGEFTTGGNPLDTTHLFFTAKCSTNVQGGYEIRYCSANKNKDGIVLTFSDGLPAYASEYYIYIRGDSFYFRPKTIYPLKYRGEKISYHVTKQKLTLNKNSYSIGDKLVGYVDTEFIETVSVLKRGTQSHRFYLRGLIKTPLH